MKKEYCTQNGGDCGTCSLVNYGRDCLNVPLNGESVLKEYCRGRKPRGTDPEAMPRP